MNLFVTFLILLILGIAAIIAYHIIMDFMNKNPKLITNVPRKKRNLFKVIDKRFGILGTVIKRQRIGTDRDLLTLKSGGAVHKIAYFNWELAPVNNIAVLAGKDVAVFEYVGSGKTKNQIQQNLQRATDASELEMMKKKVVEKDAYENQRAKQIVDEAIRFAKARAESRKAEARYA